MKILSIQQVRAADAFTIANEPIRSIDLMERAARACYFWFHQNISRGQKGLILCGMGNNGGDGLALARMLHLAGFSVEVVIIEHTQKSTADFDENLKRLQKLPVSITHVTSADELKWQADFYVDAMLGSGLNSPLRGVLAQVVEKLNAEKGHKIAIDIPTGLFADDNAGNQKDKIVNADETLTFQFPKFSFMFPGFGDCCGKLIVLDIGLHPKFIADAQTPHYFITAQLAKRLLPERKKFQHKGSFGHALIFAGSLGKVGAAILATRAALKSGVGLVTAAVPNCGIVPMQTANPEVMTMPQSGQDFLTAFAVPSKTTAVAIGPGLGQNEATKSALLQFLAQLNLPTIFDADALNIIAAENAWNLLPENCILTPHLGELSRMTGQKIEGENVYEVAQKFAKKWKQILVVKGAHTAIYLPNGEVFFNSTGSSAMATAGSGDVLSGIIAGLLAQGCSPEQAAIVGVYFHGLAGEAAAKQLGERAVVASDIISNLRIQ